MNVKQWIVGHWIKFPIEILIILVFQVGWLLSPRWRCVVDLVIFVSINVFAIFPFLFFTKNDRNWQEFAVFLQQFFNTFFFQIFLGVGVNVEHDVGTDVFFLDFVNCEIWATVARPFNCFCTFLVWFCKNFNRAGNHKCRVETKSEVANNGFCLAFEFLQKLIGTRKCDLVDVFVNFFGSHTNTIVGNSNGFCFFVYWNTHCRIRQILAVCTKFCKCF